MIGLLLRAAGLTAVYVLVLTSVAPGDIAVGGLLALGVAFAVRPRHARADRARPFRWIRAAASTLWRTALEMVRGSWRVARFCLGASATPGLVELPCEGRSRVEIGVWGVITGEAPDEVVVDVDEERKVLIVHLVDAEDPDAIRARHRDNLERWRREAGR